MLASCASATTLAASACSCLPASRGCRCAPARRRRRVLAAHDGDIRNAAIDPRGDVEARGIHLALHQQGSGRTRYQIERPATAAATRPTMMPGIRAETADQGFAGSFGCAGAAPVGASGRGISGPVRCAAGLCSESVLSMGSDPAIAINPSRAARRADGQSTICTSAAATSLKSDHQSRRSRPRATVGSAIAKGRRNEAGTLTTRAAKIVPDRSPFRSMLSHDPAPLRRHRPCKPATGRTRWDNHEYRSLFAPAEPIPPTRMGGGP